MRSSSYVMISNMDSKLSLDEVLVSESMREDILLPA